MKKFFIVLLLIIVFLAASVYIFRANIKQYAITTILKSFPLPNVALANVNFDETAGKLKLEGIKVKNPRGFKGEYMMEADSVDMNISFATKPELRLNISDIEITDPVLYVERSGADKWNIMEYSKKEPSASLDKDSRRGFIKEAFAAETEKKSEVILPRKISINNGVVRLMDNFVSYGRTHNINFYPVTGTVTLDYSPEKSKYEKISFDGSCHIEGESGRILKGKLELYPVGQYPPYAGTLNAYNVPLEIIKPYLDSYTPFIVKNGSFNIASEIKSENGQIAGDHVMEFMNLEFDINPRKSNIPFLETSVQKLTLYLTDQKGNVVIDFKQRGRVGGAMHWSLGPIATRAIGMMAVDTVISVIQGIEKGASQGDAIKELLPKDIPPEVIDIFRGIMR